MSQDFYNKFIEVYKADKRYIKSWLVAWDYQLKRKKRKAKYSENQPSDFFAYNGPSDLTKWMKWFNPVYPNCYDTALTQPLIDKSLENDKKILSELKLDYDFSTYHQNVGINNAHDFLIPRFYPVPQRYQIKTVLDFGAGYGRQANLWTSLLPHATYIGVDAIPNSYTLQNLYYKTLGVPVYDYVENKNAFKFDADKKGIYHLPTWRLDLIPDNSVDMAMCVQVIPELNATLIKHIIKEFSRILKPGGMFYIRDHYEVWNPAGKIDINQYLIDTGFVLEFKAHLILDKDLHGIPKIWRKAEKEVIASQTMTTKAKLKQVVEDIDTLSGGMVNKLAKKIKNR